MTTRPRPTKRVLAIRRAPDGSAFQKCRTCGVSVAIALFDMHDCESKMDNRNSKRFKRMTGMPSIPNATSQHQHYRDHQPVSPYRLFMESFMKGHETENFLEMDRIGFEKWKNMSEEEKYPYVYHAKLLDDLHQEALNREANEIIKVDDEADSAMVGKIDKFNWINELSSESESSENSSSELESSSSHLENSSSDSQSTETSSSESDSSSSESESSASSSS